MIIYGRPLLQYLSIANELALAALAALTALHLSSDKLRPARGKRRKCKKTYLIRIELCFKSEPDTVKKR